MSPYSSQSVIKKELSSADGLASVFLMQTLTFWLEIADGYQGTSRNRMTTEGNLIPRLKLWVCQRSLNPEKFVKMCPCRGFLSLFPSVFDIIRCSNRILADAPRRARARARTSHGVWSGSRWGDILLPVTKPALEEGEPEVKEATTIPRAFI